MQKAEEMVKKFEKRNPKQIYIMKLHESPRPDVSPSFINKKYLSA
jgi:hypothetical protein